MYFKMRQVNAAAQLPSHGSYTVQMSFPFQYDGRWPACCWSWAAMNSSAGRRNGSEETLTPTGLARTQLCWPETRPAWSGVEWLEVYCQHRAWGLACLIGWTFFVPWHKFFCSQLERRVTIPVQFWQSCIWSLMLELSSRAVHCFPSRAMLSTRGMPCPRGLLRPAAALQ